MKNWDSANPQSIEGTHYMRDYDAVDPLTEIVKVHCPVLIVQGGQDRSGVHPENGDRLYEARLAARPDATAEAFFPDLQHFYKRADPGLTSQDSMMLETETDPAVAEAISDWLDSIEGRNRGDSPPLSGC